MTLEVIIDKDSLLVICSRCITNEIFTKHELKYILDLTRS